MSENQNTEWKASWRDDYLKWICGFAYDAKVHLLEWHHSERFRKLMDTLMPAWRLQLNRAPLSHEEWRYQATVGLPSK